MHLFALVYFQSLSLVVVRDVIPQIAVITAIVAIAAIAAEIKDDYQNSDETQVNLKQEPAISGRKYLVFLLDSSNLVIVQSR